MKKFLPIIDSIHFQITYTSGHLYFDRCGQCLIDIERTCEGWLTTSVDQQTGMMERPDKSFSLSFNNNQFGVSIQKAFKIKIDDIAQEVAKLWKVIQANLGLDEFLRVGCRINYFLATESIDESERRLQKAELNVKIPERLIDAGYNIKTRNIITILTKDNIEYRVQLHGITRYEAINPDAIIKTEPRLLSSKQNKFRVARMNQLAEYSANPMYAINLDVDCVQLKPDNFFVEEYILAQSKIIETEFLPILEKL